MLWLSQPRRRENPVSPSTLTGVRWPLEKSKSCARPCCSPGTSQPLSVFCSGKVKKLTLFVHPVTLRRHLLQTLCRLPGTHILFLPVQWSSASRFTDVLTPPFAFNTCYPCPYPRGFALQGLNKQSSSARSGPPTVLQSSAVSPPNLQSADIRSHLSQSSRSSPLTTGVTLLQAFSRSNTVDTGSRTPRSVRIWVGHGFVQLHSFIFCLFLDDLLF